MRYDALMNPDSPLRGASHPDAQDSDTLRSARNPFRPTFGVPPLFWVGRALILDSFHASLLSGPGSFGRAMVISGARGIGKTVLLTELEDLAEQLGWVKLRTSGRTGIVDELINTTIPQLIESLDPQPKRRVKNFGISGVGTIGLELSEARPYQATLITELRRLLSLVDGAGVVITVDEVQDADAADLTQLAVAFQDLVRDEINVAIIMAGLPQGINTLLDLPGATFLRRAQRHILGPFSPDNSSIGFVSTAQGSGIEFTDKAVASAINISQGYPFLVQLVGSLSWTHAQRRGSHLIDPCDVNAISATAISAMGLQVHAPAVSHLTAAQRQFLDAMALVSRRANAPGAEDDAGAYGNAVAISAIAEEMGRKVTSLSQVRSELIKADLIEAAGHGLVRSVIPYMDDYLLSTDSMGRVD